MSRFTTITTFNTGAIASQGTGDFNITITSNFINVAKIKIVPSGSTIGYMAEIFKKNTFLSVDRQYSTRTNTQGSFYDPSDRDGNEVLEGWVLPYEDLDSSLKLHFRITNNDLVGRSYDVTIEYEDYIAATLAGIVSTEILETQGAGTAFTLAYTPQTGTFVLYRGGMRQRVTEDYTRSGTALVLILPLISGERLEASYIHS